ncbi:MAG: RNA-binding protein [Thaumarchaeota archaeon]|nr:RNA-binding protein [Nitrososphaerota archaeon]
MSLKAVESSLASISRELEEVQAKRELLIKESRSVISTSARAIVAAHTGRLSDAEAAIKEAKKSLSDLKEAATPELMRYLSPAEMEYTEASTVYAVASGKSLPSSKELKVDGGPYILGLLDTIGELKRMIYDRIREGKSREASYLFELAEQLYLMLAPTAVHDHVVPGVRKKLDVARVLIEGTRAAITEEVRRAELIKRIKRAEKALGGKSDA